MVEIVSYKYTAQQNTWREIMRKYYKSRRDNEGKKTNDLPNTLELTNYCKKYTCKWFCFVRVCFFAAAINWSFSLVLSEIMWISNCFEISADHRILYEREYEREMRGIERSSQSGLKANRYNNLTCSDIVIHNWKLLSDKIMRSHGVWIFWFIFCLRFVVL